MTYRFAYDLSQVDVTRCAMSGQAFRWSEIQPGVWFGQDGDHWFRVDTVAGVAESNRPADAFQSYFQLDRDIAAITAQILDRGPELQTMVPGAAGLRILKPQYATEVLFSFLCSANNHLPRIIQMVGKLAAYPEPPSLQGRGDPEAQAFPAAATLARVSEAELRAQGFGYRAATIPKVARILADNGGEEWLQTLKQGTYEEAVKALIPLPGVGRKLADCIALFGLGFEESVPVDVHIWRQLVRLYHPELHGQALTDHRYRTVSDRFRERFGNLSGWAQQWLFVDSLRR